MGHEAVCTLWHHPMCTYLDKLDQPRCLHQAASTVPMVVAAVYGVHACSLQGVLPSIPTPRRGIPQQIHKPCTALVQPPRPGSESVPKQHPTKEQPRCQDAACIGASSDQLQTTQPQNLRTGATPCSVPQAHRGGTWQSANTTQRRYRAPTCCNGKYPRQPKPQVLRVVPVSVAACG